MHYDRKSRIDEMTRRARLGQPLTGPLTSSVGERIRSLRVEKGISLRQMAIKTGLNIGTLSQIENGKKNPGLKSLLALANLFGLSIDQLVGK